MISKNFFLFLAILLPNFLLSYQQTKASYLFTQSVRNQYKGLTNFSITYMNFSGNAKIITFGGKINKTSQNAIFQSRPYANSTTIVYNTNSVKPSPRQNHCTLVYQYKLYIYGGTTIINQTKYILRDLWQFNSIFLTWSFISNSSLSITSCNLIRNQSNIIVIGVENNAQNNSLVMMKYSMLNNLWSKLSYNYADYIQISGKVWYGQLIDTLISIDNISPNDRKQITNKVYKYSNTIYTNTIYTLPFKTINSTVENSCTNSSNITTQFCPSNYTYLLISQTRILFLNLVNLTIYLIRNIDYFENTKILDYQISDKWMFIFKLSNSYVENNQTTKYLIMQYYSLANFYQSGENYYSIPQDQIQLYNIQIDSLSYKTVLVNGDIYIVSEVTMESWILYQHCDLKKNISNVKICIYDQIHCQMGWRGPFCNLSMCPNTLYLYDQVKNQQIYYQCSQHGQCTENGCVCDQYWTGQDCSIYTRKQCKGQLIQNWPVMNCQCKEETLGGNACQIVFCYNDCSQHGECNNGVCVCETGYYGKDCSITIIQFPGLEVSI